MNPFLDLIKIPLFAKAYYGHSYKRAINYSNLKHLTRGPRKNQTKRSFDDIKKYGFCGDYDSKLLQSALHAQSSTLT